MCIICNVQLGIEPSPERQYESVIRVVLRLLYSKHESLSILLRFTEFVIS